jgi:pilus assembly protein CpaF
MAFALPLPAIRRQIASGVDILVHLGRLRDRSRRVLEIAEIDGYENENILLHPLYEWDGGRKSLVKMGELKHTGKLERTGVVI